MNKKLLVFFSLFVIMMASNCKKDETDSFCQIKRDLVSSINNQEASIGFYAKYNRWAVFFKVSNPNNIDTRVIGLTCDISPNFQIDGLPVIVSGNKNKFNTIENINPQLGGDELFYFEILKISKK
jgi:hypothetical protein